MKIIESLPQKNTSSATTQNCKIKPSYVCQWYNFNFDNLQKKTNLEKTGINMLFYWKLCFPSKT